MKRCLAIYKFAGLLFLVLFSEILYSQTDPLNWTEPIKVESNDIFLIWVEGAGYNGAQSYQKVYDLEIGVNNLPIDSMLDSSPKQSDDRLGGGNFTDAASGKFTTGPRDNVVSAWAGTSTNSPSWIYLMIPVFDTSETMWTQSVQDSIGGDIQNDRIYVRTLDIDGDSLDEFILSYLDEQDSIHIQLYDVDENLNLTEIASICDEKTHGDYANFESIRYAIETGDFNNDGTEEIALLKINNETGIHVYLKIYDIEENEIISGAEDEIYSFSLTGQEYLAIGIVKGQFMSNEKDELGISIISAFNGQFRAYNWLVDLNESLDDFNLSDDRQFNVSNETGFCIASGDLTKDGIDELVISNEENIYVMKNDGDTLAVGNIVNNSIVSGGPSYYGEITNGLKISDANQDGLNEVVLIKDIINNNQQDDGFYISVYAADTTGLLTLIGQKFGDEQLAVDPENPEYEYRPYSIAVGNFDGLNFTIGEPIHYQASDVLKPIVVLNAPPIHFDQFEEDIYDLNNCYNGEDCDFVSTYIYSNSETVEVSTEVHKDWTISAGLAYSGSVTVEPLGVGVSYNIETHMLYEHGEHFSNSDSEITQVDIEVEIGANEDDVIFSTVVDYDIWEYPVYHGNETEPRNTILTTVPSNVSGQWFPSKSYTAVNYLPDHEVSNILSYPDYDLFEDNPNSAQIIQADYVSDSYELDGASDYNWDLTMSEFTSNEADTVRENGIDVRLQYGLLLFEGNYQDKKTVNYKTSVSNSINLNVHLGALDMGVGDVKYTVTPYSYWDNKDALVIDYTTKPGISPPGFPETWWQEKYGNDPDPTFILPWRLDPEKGFTLSEEAKRYQTKDIIFSPVNPQAGDSLEITAVVRNFSLIGTNTSVDVSFYIGDPDLGGTPIIGSNGSNTVSTESAIPARGKSNAIFTWVVPENLVAFPRIYAVLDIDDMISEVHEVNNKGFNVLGFASGITEIEEYNELPESDFSSNAYPNPFYSNTNISYSLKSRNRTTISVYNYLGNKIAVLLDKYQSPGNYIVPFNANKLESGIYFYTIQSGNLIESKKMILIK